MSHQCFPRPAYYVTLFTLLLIASPIGSSHDIHKAGENRPPPKEHPFHRRYNQYNPKRSVRTPIALSSLGGPTSLSSSSNRMLLVDLSALNHRAAIGAATKMATTPYEDYFTSSAYDSSDPWEESFGSEDRSQRRQRSREDEYDYRLNEIGSSDRLLVPYTNENAVGLHYATLPFLEGILTLQGSREDALTDFLQERLGSRDSKRSVFVSQSWLPGGHPEPRRKNSHRRPQGKGRKSFNHQGPPSLPFIFSSKGWHPGGRKRRSTDDPPWPKRDIFFSRGWGAAGDPLHYPQKKPAPLEGAEGTPETIERVLEPPVGQARASALVSDVAPDTARSHKRPRNHWGIPHLFGPYW
ncbi:uncharacterized protein LOC135383635 [Ornithodoros turicata]|uniref:uncharacterized protein LOC135383635 n=1 Tax=Ornithodoros turicata TaxID=34597 RepID=UPI00313A4AB5